MFERVKKGSLGIKIILPLSLALIITFSILTLINITYQNRVLLDRERGVVRRLTDSILTGIRYPMMTGDQEIVQLQFDKYKELEGIEVLHLLDHKGIIRRSTDRSLIGEKSKARNLEVALDGKEYTGIEQRERTGSKFYSDLRPILNEQSCYACHGSEQRVLGVLRLFVNWQPVDKALAVSRNHNILLSLFSLAFISLLIFIFLQNIIIRPIHRLHLGTEIISTGNLGYKVGTNAKDEIGQLSRAFDRMTENLKKTTTSITELDKEITERKKAEEKIRLSALYARSLIETSLDPLVTISPDGKITDVNKATEQATGVPRENLIGSNFSDYFTEPDKAREGYKQVFLKGFVKDYPLAIQHKSGGVTDVLYNASVYKNETGEIQGIFAAARDITERKEAEEEQKRLMKDLEETNKILTGREIRMIELKKEVNKLSEELGKPAPYETKE